ncbi:MAG: hypothetical protein A2145_03055 [candidate division Zixibacteria bacterium RBG_16_40_9]|nr:MAG: hypothetical protein A2145_03055 [candidate division Zixibacteria bacterium RBG_16_40_9]
MENFIPYLPILTTILSVVFAYFLVKHYKSKKSAIYLLWWTIGVITYGAGTLTESINTLWGWNEFNFRCWYVFGALLGGAPLAQGTVYLLLSKKIAHGLAFLLVTTVIIASVFVFLSPIDQSLLKDNRLSGIVLEWKWVRYIPPFINTYAFVFLCGGAVYSAWKYYFLKKSSKRFLGNIYIAIGALLPGIGGIFTRYGHVEVLYVTELFGLLLIYIGYLQIRSDRSESIHQLQKAKENLA